MNATLATAAVQTATLLAYPVTNAKNLGRAKELVRAWSAVGAGIGGKLHEVIIVRWYMSRSGDGASPQYCSLWVQSHPVHASGHGKAGGYGYCKMSAAFQAACDSAGIKLSQPVDGHGEGAVRDAMRAICAALGYADCLIVEHS